MSKYKMVPMEPTIDMVIAGEDAWDTQLDKRLFAKDNGEAFATYPSEETHELCSRVAYRAMLAAAPDAVQEEPVAWLRFRSHRVAADDVIEGLEICEPGETGDDGGPAFPVYTAPQPVPTATQDVEDPWRPSEVEYDRAIHHNPDAKAWADLFVQTFPAQVDRHDLMLGWFASAMMAMHDHLAQKEKPTAPTVHGEPFGYVVPGMAARLGKGEVCGISVLDQPEDGHTLPVYLGPQPAEQQPSAGDSLTPVPDEVFAAEFAAWWEEHGQFCRAGGGDYERTFAFEAWRHLYPQLMSLQVAAAEQKPATDMPVLAEALRQYQHNDGSGLVFGYDKLLVDQHVARLVEALEAVMEFGCDPKSNRGKWALEKAESTLAGSWEEIFKVLKQ